MDLMGRTNAVSANLDRFYKEDLDSARVGLERRFQGEAALM
jgi:hypothetical protein